MMNKKTKQIILFTLGVASLLYLGTIFIDNYKSVNNIFNYISLKSITFALIPCFLMLMSQAYLHTMIIEDIENKRIKNKLNIISTYSNAQIIRYLPGKVWGIVYQSEKLATKFPRKTTWFTNINQMAITSANSFIIFGAMYIYFLVGTTTAIIYVLCSLILLFIFIRKSILFLIINKFLKEKLRLLSIPSITPSRIITEIVLLQLDWIFYFLVWYLLAPSHISSNSFVLIGATYAAASLVGMLIFVMPNGWLVRETSFIWLGGMIGISQNILIIYGVIARLFFMVVDLFWALLLLAISKSTIKEVIK